MIQSDLECHEENVMDKKIYTCSKLESTLILEKYLPHDLNEFALENSYLTAEEIFTKKYYSVTHITLKNV